EQDVPLEAGQAEVRFSCNVNLDPGCMAKVRVVGLWKINGTELGGDVRVAVGPQGTPAPQLNATFDPAFPGDTNPCLFTDAGTTPCQADGGCPHGFECLNQQRCELRGSSSPLQVSLHFDSAHDLDLHVDEPLRDGGVCEVFWGEKNENFMGGCGGLGS